MKRFIFLLSAVLFCFNLSATEFRTVSFGGLPNVYSMGNGKMCAYGKDADILQIFGYPYSAPSMFGMFMTDRGITVRNTAELGTAVWQHAVYDIETDKMATASIQDFMSYKGNALVRQVIAYDEKVGIDICACAEANSRYLQYGDHLSLRPLKIDGFNEAFLFEIAAGVPFYSRYISPEGYKYIIATKGNAHITASDTKAVNLHIDVSKGNGSIYVICGDDASVVANTPDKALLKDCLKNWKDYSKTHLDIKYPNLDKTDALLLREETDRVASLIRSQQCIQGGVIAGVVYHMFYVRDQYGVSRSLLAMGHTDEARDILDFYFRIWEKYGYIRNAQAAGWDGIFHCHENDESEITGYLVVQAFDYYRKTGDTDYLKKILPMLQWATEAQQRNLIDGMLPFNGDETYIAGGVVPRSVMFHGSAEATLLFIEGSRSLMSFVKDQKLWDEQKIQSLNKDVEECISLFRQNFFVDGKYYLNNPEREKKVNYPETRPGVCLYPGYLDHYPVTYHYKGSLYFCEDCMKRDMTGIEVPESKRYTIPSAYLFPYYIDTQILTPEEKQSMLNEVIELYKKTGKISSNSGILGYDFGMFLYALVKTGNPLAREVYDRMMTMKDETGAWVEYYVDGKATGCPCRPWESGINIEAAIEFATK